MPRFAAPVQARSEKKGASPRAAAPQPRRDAPQRSPLWHAIQLKAARSAARAPAARAESGSGLPPPLKAGIEHLSGLAMDDVRVHRNSPEPTKLGALAYAQGNEIHLGSGQEQHLPHEAWHVVQQKEGRVKATMQMKGVGISSDATLEAEADTFGRQALSCAATVASPPHLRHATPGTAVVQCQGQPGHLPPGVRERVLTRKEVAERSRTVVRIEVTGHASPRWRSARSDQKADELNWHLAEARARQVRLEIEKLVHDLLPNRPLVYEYRFRASTEMPTATPIRALDESTDIAVDYQGRGSTQTLEEAGKRGRKANDDPMRRVEVRVTLHSQDETDVEEGTERSEIKPGTSTNWSIWVAAEAGVEEVVKGGAILIQLRNEKTGHVGTYSGWTGGVGASVGISVAKTSPPDFEKFTTPEAMRFADFDGAEFSIFSSGVSIGIGLEWSKFHFTSFPGGEQTPAGIQVGGLTLGGFELNLGSAVRGRMLLADHPSETYTKVTHSKHIETFESLASESSIHRVLFATGSSKVDARESDNLNAYLVSIVTRSGL